MGGQIEPRDADSALHGVLLVDKPRGPTSAGALGFVRWAAQTRRVGHCGTLDPLASGLLIVCIGEATKLVEVLSGFNKTYEAEVVLGCATDTWDAQGRVVETCPITREQTAALESTAQGLVGEWLWAPPPYSAVHIDGERAHARARRGERVELPPRPMGVRAIEALEVLPPDRLRLRLSVTKGTYVRTIAVELGRRLGLPAHLVSLRRAAVSAWSVDDARVLRPTARDPAAPADGRGHGLYLPGTEGRAQARQALAGALLRLPEVVEGPVELPETAVRALEGGDPLARMAMGQRVALSGAVLGALGIAPATGPVALWRDDIEHGGHRATCATMVMGCVRPGRLTEGRAAPEGGLWVLHPAKALMTPAGAMRPLARAPGPGQGSPRPSSLDKAGGAPDPSRAQT